MTIEELEIIIEANIEPAIKEIKKLMPQIKSSVEQAVSVAQKSMEQVDMKKMTSKVQKAIQDVKNKVSNLKKSNKDNEVTIKINNEEAKKQITQLEKEISSLQKKISARQMKLDLINPQMDKIISDTRNEVVPDGVSKNDPSMDKVVDNSLAKNASFKALSNQSQKLYTDIELYNKQLDIAKSKLSQLKQEVSSTSASQNKLTSFFSAFKGKIEQAKKSVGTMKNSFNKMPQITQKITNNIKNMGSGVKNSFKHILKYAGALLSLRGIYSVLSNSAQAWLSSQNQGAQQLSANIEYMKYAMGSVFAPVIETVINLVYKLMKAVQSLIYAFTGVNIFAKATASSMNKTAGSASKASKSLTGVHNEINNISENNESGSGTATPSFDLSGTPDISNSILESIKNGDWFEIGTKIGEKINTAIGNIDWDNIKEKAGNIGTNIAQFLNGSISSTNWTGIGNTLAQGINTVFSTGYQFVTTFDWSSYGTAIGDTINGFFQNVDWVKIATTLSEGIKGALTTANSFLEETDWEKIGESIGTFLKNIDWYGVLDGLEENVADAFVGIIEAAWGLVTETFTDIDLSWSGLWESLKKSTDLGLGIQDELFEEGGKAILESMGFTAEDANYIWDNLWTLTKQGLDIAWNNMVQSVKTKANEILTKISEFVINAKEKIVTKFNEIKEKVKQVWEDIKTKISTKFTEIKNSITTTINNIKTKWNEIWGNIKTTVTNIWNGIWGSIKTVINSILGGIESFVNGTIRGINKILSGISSVANAVGSLIGLDPIDLQLSEISLPRLAKGNVAYSETMAIFGEYSGASHNPEITTPQNIMRETFADVLSDYGATSGSGQPIRVQIYWGTKAVVDEIIDGINEKTRQTGKAQIKVSYA